MVCHPFEQMACVMEIVASGVLDKHPGLRVGFFESGLGWLPYWLERLDEHKESMGHLVPTLKRDPTEIWSEQCFVTMEAGEGEAFAQLAEHGLAHTVVWGSDYPHYDCTYPGALAELDTTFDDLGRPDLRRAVLHDNPRRFLGLSTSVRGPPPAARRPRPELGQARGAVASNPMASSRATSAPRTARSPR
jgi:predicted TIM-barrel fold metal-dependent hydrolase